MDNIFTENYKMDSNCEDSEINQKQAGIVEGIDKRDTCFCLGNGITFHDIPGMIKIIYTGLLAQNGAEEVQAVLGYGDNTKWENIEYINMQKSAINTFEMLVFRKQEGNLNLAFKDSAGNWDNNLGANYIFYHNEPDKDIYLT